MKTTIALLGLTALFFVVLFLAYVAGYEHLLGEFLK